LNLHKCFIEALQLPCHKPDVSGSLSLYQFLISMLSCSNLIQRFYPAHYTNGKSNSHSNWKSKPRSPISTLETKVTPLASQFHSFRQIASTWFGNNFKYYFLFFSTCLKLLFVFPSCFSLTEFHL
jgi:hypothetical protein